MASSAVSAQTGRCIVVPVSIVPIAAACKYCGHTSPLAVDTGLANPAALSPTITMPLLNDLGKLTRLYSLGVALQSIHTRLSSSVLILLSLGTRTASTPMSDSLTCIRVSPAATRIVSIAKLGCNVSSAIIIKGIRRTTPSTSGNVFTTPTPAAISLCGSTLLINPGYSTKNPCGSCPICWTALPRFKFLLLPAVATIGNTVGKSFMIPANTASCLKRSFSGIKTLNTTRPASWSYSSCIMRA